LRVRHPTDGKTLQPHVHGYTQRDSTGYTDEGQGYNQIKRAHHPVGHGRKEWARDDDGDGIREVHTNTIEGLWTTARKFLRPFRGVHTKYLHHYLAMCEHTINLKRISPQFIAQLVTQHRSVT
jgi:transposase